MHKITFLGAGSTVFAKNLIGNILSFPKLAESTISSGQTHIKFGKFT